MTTAVGHLQLVAVLHRLPDGEPGQQRRRRHADPGPRRGGQGAEHHRPAAASEAIINAFKNKDQAALKPIADFWNTGFDADQLPSDPSLYLSTGPYKVTAYQQRASLTLERNPDYNWGPKPAFDKITYTIIGDPTAAVQALTNEETDIISPQATADIYQAVSGLADRGIEVAGRRRRHLRARRPRLRQRRAVRPGEVRRRRRRRRSRSGRRSSRPIPRTEILDRLIKPINPEAVLRESFVLVPGAPGYDEVVGGERDERLRPGGHPRRAKALLAEAGVTTARSTSGCCIAANNPRRSNEYDLMKASAAQAGLQPHRRAEPELGHAAADHLRLRRLPVRLEQHLDRPRRAPGELRHRRSEQLRQVLQRRGRRCLRQDHQRRRARGGVRRHDR